MKQKIEYYKVRRDGHDFLNNVLKELCYESYEEAKTEVRAKIKELIAYLSDKDGYEIIHEYEREDILGYYFQMVTTYKGGFASIIYAAIDKKRLLLK